MGWSGLVFKCPPSLLAIPTPSGTLGTENVNEASTSGLVVFMAWMYRRDVSDLDEGGNSLGLFQDGDTS